MQVTVQTIKIHKPPARGSVQGKCQLESLVWGKDEIVSGERHLVLVSHDKAIVQLIELTKDLRGAGLQIRKLRQAPKHISKST